MAKQKAKVSKEEVASRRKTKAVKARHIAYICAEINGNRLPNGRLRRGAITTALNEHKMAIPWITVDLIKKGLQKSTTDSTIITRAISDVTDPTYGSSPGTEQDPSVPPSTIAAETIEAASTGPSTKKVGRPRGTTVKAKKEKSEKEEALVNEIATEWMSAKHGSRMREWMKILQPRYA